MHEQFRNRALGWWAHFVSEHPRWIQVAALGLALISIVISVMFLDFQGDRNDLLSKDIPWNKVYRDWTDRFPTRNDVLVVIDGGRTSPDDAKAVADEVAQRLAGSEHVADVVWRFDARGFTPKAARLLPMDEYQKQVAAAARSQVLLSSPTLVGYLQQTTGALREGGRQGMSAEEGAEGLNHLAAWLDAMQTAAVTPPASEGNPFTVVSSPAIASRAAAQWRYMSNAAEDIFFVRVTPQPAENEINPYEPALASIRAIVQEVDARHQAIDVGMTGVRVLESEETAAATRDSTLASILAAVLITVLLIVSFHGWRTPLLGMIALGCAIAWTFGFVTIAIGHLQVLSVVFTVILLGLGIDYAVHLATHFELVRHKYPDTSDGFADALKESFTVTGPGIMTGALTTAVAFFMTSFTSFKGVQEMGQIAAVGVMLCLIAMGSMLPAMLRSYSRRHRHIKPHEDRRYRKVLTRISTPFVRHAWLTMGVAAVLACISGYAVTGMHFDFNLLKLHPKDAPGLRWMQVIAQRTDQSIWYGISQADSLDEARERVEAFRALDVVSEVGGVGMLMPVDAAEKRQLAADVRDALEPALSAAVASTKVVASESPDAGASYDQLMSQLRAMQLALSTVDADEQAEVVKASLANVRDELAESIALFQNMTPENQVTAVAWAGTHYRGWRAQLVLQLASLLDPSPLQPMDVPDALTKLWIGKDGRYALEIYPKPPEGREHDIDAYLAPQRLAAFATQVRTVDPEVTGPMLQIYYSGVMMREAYQWAGILALIAVIVLVTIDFRSLYDALLTLVPVALGFGVTFAIMRVVDISINPANIMVLPLMFGIGVDAGVHVIHRYRQHPGEHPPGLTHGTGKGITITSLTTMIGFGVMMFASHRGIASLGFVLTSGILMTLLACLTVMPAWLELRNRYARKRATSTPTGDAAK